MDFHPAACGLALIFLGAAVPVQAQGLPELGPINPMSSSRSGLYFQPYRDPAPGRWTAQLALDYASIIEYNRFTIADYVLDAEVLKLGLSLGRDLGPRTFILLNASVGGAYAGFLDGFLDWYHGLLGIRVREREKRPHNDFLYTLTLPSGASLQRSAADLFLNDVRIGLGARYGGVVQSVLSLTLPTSTRPDGYGKGVVSLGVLNTLRARLDPRLVFEGSLGLGFTPRHGTSLRRYQRELFASATSGLRLQLWGGNSVYANLFYHSPYYRDTTLPALDLRELSLDFGWILRARRGSEWRVGLTEDLEPGGPAVDLVIRLGRKF